MSQTELAPYSMSPPVPGIPTRIVAISFLLCSSTRLTVPSPWLIVQMELLPDVKNRGFCPTSTDSRISPLRPSTAVSKFLSTPLIQMIPPLKIGLYEPGGIEIFWRTLLVEGSIRTRVPFLSTTSQTLSSLQAIPPSGAAGAIGSTAVIELLTESILS